MSYLTKLSTTLDDDFFSDPGLKDLPFENKRTAVRYIRKDLTAVLYCHGLFNSSRIFVKLGDISSKGALIASNRKFNTKKKISLHLSFTDGKTFIIPAQIVYRRGIKGKYHYGLKFIHSNDRLGEHLLKTQTDLHMK